MSCIPVIKVFQNNLLIYGNQMNPYLYRFGSGLSPIIFLRGANEGYDILDLFVYNGKNYSLQTNGLFETVNYMNVYIDYPSTLFNLPINRYGYMLGPAFNILYS